MLGAGKLPGQLVGLSAPEVGHASGYRSCHHAFNISIPPALLVVLGDAALATVLVDLAVVLVGVAGALARILLAVLARLLPVSDV